MMKEISIYNSNQEGKVLMNKLKNQAPQARKHFRNLLKAQKYRIR